MGLRKQVTINTIYRISFLLVQLLNTILISRLTGPAGFGTYSLIIVNANILLVFTSMGIPSGLLYHASARDIPINRLMKILWVSSLLQFLFIVIIEIIHYQFKSKFWIWPSAAFLAGLAGVVFFISIVLTEKFYSIYNGYQRFHTYNLVMLVFALIFCAALFLLFFNPAYVKTEMIIYFFVFIQAVQTLVLWIILKLQKIGISAILEKTEFGKKFATYSFFAFLSNALHFLVTRVDFWIIHVYKGENELGIYALASKMGQMFLILPALFAGILLPSITSKTLKPEKLESTFRFMNSANLLAMVLLVVCSGWFVPLAFGSEFKGVVFPLLLLLPGILFLSGQTLLAAYFAGSGKPEINLYTTLIALAIVLIMDFLLIPIYGASGASIASAIAYMAGAIYSFSMYRRMQQYPWSKLFVSTSDLKQIKKYFTPDSWGRTTA